jgi:hypothetical protein
LTATIKHIGFVAAADTPQCCDASKIGQPPGQYWWCLLIGLLSWGQDSLLAMCLFILRLGGTPNRSSSLSASSKYGAIVHVYSYRVKIIRVFPVPIYTPWWETANRASSLSGACLCSLVGDYQQGILLVSLVPVGDYQQGILFICCLFILTGGRLPTGQPPSLTGTCWRLLTGHPPYLVPNSRKGTSKTVPPYLYLCARYFE